VHFGVLAFSVAVVWGFAVAAVPVLIGVRVILVVQLEVVLSTSAISKIISYFWNFGWVRIERFARDQ
jgi:ascorbate-specific PTS system EIIC-type component UlaA